ncbi:hypothetical protein Bpfe_031547 [Biomphalaria pfeifferi]|uniref:Uncharacterized protein n=1 Tax=Biomphalaria pfeifferi TaxID=112525 RepID=A0AAD8AMM7_BIOPF|nr:hypothetical protein Bpfe_031547 [Biomphalaria pfeifferi]
MQPVNGLYAIAALMACALCLLDLRKKNWADTERDISQCHAHTETSDSQVAESQQIAVRWLPLLITTPRPRTKSSTNDLTPSTPHGVNIVQVPARTDRRNGKDLLLRLDQAGPVPPPRGVAAPNNPAISLPPDAGVRKISSHIRAGF